MAINLSTILINASKQRVWDILTKPEFIKLWQYGSDVRTTWEAGTEIRFRTEWQGTVFEQWGRVLEIVPTEIVRYSLFAPRPDLEDKPENYFVMRYSLQEEDGKTRLEITQEDNRPGAVQEAPQGEENPILQSLKTLAETP